MLLPTITIRQPWVWLILQDQLPDFRKDIENRSWPLPEKYIDTPVLLHTSAAPRFNGKLVKQALHEIKCRGYRSATTEDIEIDPLRREHLISTGMIVGIARFSGRNLNKSFDKPETWESREHLPSPWCDTTSKFWWKIAKVKAIKPVSAKGKQSFWKFDYPYFEELEGF